MATTNLASLASAIVSRVEAAVGSQTLDDLTNQRETGSVSKDASVLSEAATQAASEVQMVLGDVDGDDTQAVALGARLAMLELQAVWSATLDPVAGDREERVYRRLDRLARARIVDASDPVLGDVDETAGDVRWPASDNLAQPPED